MGETSVVCDCCYVILLIVLLLLFVWESKERAIAVRRTIAAET